MQAKSIDDRLEGTDIQWMKLGDLEGDAVLTCIDGRHDDCIAGAPGGNVGEFALLLTALEDVTGVSLRPETVEQLMRAYVERFGQFYMHTDTAALGALADELAARELLEPENHDIGDVARYVADPPQNRRGQLRRLLVRPEFTGCGHLRAVLESPTDYETRLGLIEAVIGAFFRLLWERREDIQFHVLEGDHCEEAIIDIDIDGDVDVATEMPSVRARGGRSVFVHTRGARRFLLRSSIDFLHDSVEELGLSAFSANELFNRAWELADVQLSSTVSALAPDLPVIEYKVDPTPRTPPNGDPSTTGPQTGK